MGLALLSLGGLALIVVPIILLHQYYLTAGQPPPPGARARRWRWRPGSPGASHPGRLNALVATAVALAVALPWFIMMVRSHGWQAIAALRVPPERLLADFAQTLPGRLVELAPVTLPLGLFGAVRAVRNALVDEAESRESVGGALWVIWLAVACLAPGGLAAGAAERVRPGAAGPAEPAGGADDRRPGQSPGAGAGA